jgi:hypothetical protein
MPTQAINLNLETRINALNAVLTTKEHQEAVDEALQAVNGDWPTALASLKDKLPAPALQKVALAYSLAVWSDDNIPVVTALAGQPDVTNLRDVALRFNVDKLTALVDPEVVPETTAGDTADEKKRNFAVALQHKLFATEPTAVLQRMVQEAEVPIADTTLRAGVASFLGNQPDFNMRTTSIYTALKHPEAFKGIAEEHRMGVVEQLKTLQRVQALSPIPEAVPVLMQANLTSAFQVAEMPESTFLKAHGTMLGEETARQVYTTAINSRIRNEHALMTMREALRGAGLAIIDGHEPMATRLARLQAVADQQAVPLNLEALFGSMDFCECEECTSVYSPASYFVDILQFLRNNNLGPNPADPTQPNPNIHPGIAGTPLEKLFRRRPDLGCLQLTCQNTNTVLPYIDLVNEVMESFVVHLNQYHADPNTPKQAQLEVFNVEDETSSELLAQPQHINYEAYCILKNNAVYPFTLPYHQPIDATRIFLNYLGTSLYELLDTYRTATDACCAHASFSPAEQQELQALHNLTLDRAVDAEFLGLTQEEYIILTREAFWPKRYFDITLKKTHTDAEYRQNIGVKPAHAYYGYSVEADMLSTDETQPKGLRFVKKQFLPRTGIQYVDLVELLKTQFINPNFPQGKALTLLESVRFSYRFLQTLVDTSSTDPKVRFAKLIDFLEQTQPLLPLLDTMLHPDPCQQQKPDWCMESKDLRNWVYYYFVRIGQLIVLESGEGLRLPIEGKVSTEDDIPKSIGTLHKDGTIVDENGNVIGNVTMVMADNVLIAGPVNWTDGKSFVEKFGQTRLLVKDASGNLIGYIDANGLHGWDRKLLAWLPALDTCDLEKVRLIHLDGTVVTVDEYDRMQRFIRLWRKMDWTIDETDKALIGLAVYPVGDGGGTSTASGDCHYVGFDAFKDDCSRVGGEEDWGCPDIAQVCSEITPDFVQQLVAVRKLLDLTGLPLAKLLTFWADISTAGEQSLYARLFLTHNLLGIDQVFQADTNGNYLTQPAKITEHVPVLMAALNLKADDITAIMQFRQLPDALTVSHISVLYRHSLLAKILHVRVSDLAEVIALFGTLFGDPFKNAYQTLALLETWGQMEDAGFTFRQLDYLIRNHDDALRPLAPTKKTILQITKTLYDGLNAIDRDHPDVQEGQKDIATAALIRTKGGLLFEQPVVEQILGVLEGTTVYTTNAPANLTITIPDALARKLKYSNQKDAIPPSASIQVMGILTDDERTQAKALSNHPDWAKAIDRVGKQALNFFNDVLFGIFPDPAAARGTLLAGDVSLPADQQDPNLPDPNTAPAKRFYFLQYFLPFLRQRLSHRFIVDTLSGAASLTGDVTDVLLSDVLVVGSPSQSAMHALENIKEQPVEGSNGWQGYLIPSVEDTYTFIAKSDTQPAPLLLDSQAIAFPHQQEDPSNVWSTDPMKLKNGKLYWLAVTGQSANQLQWKTATSPKAFIPGSALLPDYSAQGTEQVFSNLYKATLVVNGFSLSADEVSYWQTHAADFDGFDFNAVTLQHWRRLQAYTDLRDNLPKAATTLLDLFTWTSKAYDAAKLSEHLAAVTLWKQEDIDKLLTSDHFDLNSPAAFRSEGNLVKLRKALQVAEKIGVDINRLFQWAKPTSQFWACHQIAEDIRKTTRARYDQEDWEQVVKPLNDQLREDQKQALISYLLVQPDLIDWGVVDADSLFEFFLIDVQMDACMETSRIKQAISTVQLFVQRCMLGLEEQYGIPNDALDRDRWDWMQKYRIWEANRKVFLYPENWIEPPLRDDKSPFYKELESELLQKDINTQTVEDALKSYLFKVDEVANLKVVGLFLEQEIGQDGNEVPIKLHVFARTRNAPYFFYYRYFQTKENNWYPWEKMQVDIPSYDVEDANGNLKENGTYLTPVVWNNRLLSFFPQFMRKTAPNSKVSTKSIKDTGEDTPANIKPFEYWEIKLAASEYQNGKWTQKQVSSEAIYDNPNLSSPPTPPNPLPDVSLYEFIPRLITSPDTKVVIDVYREFSAIGAFHFTGSQLSKDNELPPPNTTVTTDFHYTLTTPPQLHSLQATGSSDPSIFHREPYFEVPKTTVTVHNDGVSLPFYHPFAHELLGKLMTGNLDALFAYYLTLTDPLKADAYGGNGIAPNGTAPYHELNRAYSLYNWEAGFHAPMLLVDRLLKSQQFDQALQMCHYVFNPSAQGLDDKRFWQFPPFKDIDAANVLEKLFLGLQPNTPDASKGPINEWRNHPFQPHVVARSRPSAYMKWVVMKYIEILIAYGDYYFRQNTLETIPLAIQCYVVAAHIYGPRGQKIPKRGKVQPQTYNSLLDKWDAFSNAMVELELAFPFSNQTPLPIGVSNGVVGLANVFGFATTLYFCIPDNPTLRGLRDTIDDRLFKIRHCEDIEGVFRKLPLFEPPIDPGLLVQAAAQGLSLSTVLNDLNSPMPNYRFYYLLQKALELCTELKALGNAFLLAKEKGDAEALSKLRAGHESSIHNLVMEVKKQQLEEAGKSLEALEQSRKGPVYRLQHYLKLIGEDLGKVPDGNTDFDELPNQIEQPVDGSGLKLIQYEKEEMDKAGDALGWNIASNAVEVLSAILHLFPDAWIDAMPLGLGVQAHVGGGSKLGLAATATSKALQTVSSIYSHQSSQATRKSGFLRQLQDRVQQANAAGYEIKNIDKQVLTQKIRIDIAQQEITNQQKQVDNAQEVEEFLRNKYTNEELYSWMEGSIRTLYYQAYTLAYDLAKRGEKVFRFERGLSTSNFIQFGYWDAAYDGLLAGERMFIGLKQLEAAYQEKRGYDYEISKHVSLRQVNPLALIQLKETGTCEFALPEVLFDMDHPGHYLRRLKSVALTVPCVVGPYTSLNCTLRLLEHKFRTNAIAKDKNDYLEKTDVTDERFSTVNVPITAIAVSSGQNDSGVFELNFRDERYIPFEGAGVISKWRLELPEQFRQFDYDTITDVIMQLRYTAVEGGDKLKKPAAESVQEYIKSVEQLSRQEGLFAAFDLKHDFSNEWYKATQPPAGATERLLTLSNLYERLPIFTKGRPPAKIQATDVYVFTPAALSASALVLTQGTDEFTFMDGPPVGIMKSFVIKDMSCPIDSWQLKIQDGKVALEKFWLLVRYVLK